MPIELRAIPVEILQSAFSVHSLIFILFFKKKKRHGGGEEEKKKVQEIRNSCGFFCGKFLQLVIKGLHYTEIYGYFAVASLLCLQASKKCSVQLEKKKNQTGKDCIGENITQTWSERQLRLISCVLMPGTEATGNYFCITPSELGY